MEHEPCMGSKDCTRDVNEAGHLLVARGCLVFLRDPKPRLLSWENLALLQGEVRAVFAGGTTGLLKCWHPRFPLLACRAHCSGTLRKLKDPTQRLPSCCGAGGL